MRKILDKNISAKNYAKFDRCKIIFEGLGVLFNYPSGDSYEVSIDIILSWFDRPHYILAGHRLVDFDLINGTSGSVFIEKIRRVMRGHALRIYLNNHAVYDVAWDTVLMACEKRYEWYGGIDGK